MANQCFFVLLKKFLPMLAVQLDLKQEAAAPRLGGFPSLQ